MNSKGVQAKASVVAADGKPRTRRASGSVITHGLGTTGRAVPHIGVRFLPHIRQLAGALRATPERLLANGQVSMPTPLLRFLLGELLESVPFDEAFYLRTYDDVREAHERGDLASPRGHFLEVGYFEGRLGCDFDVSATYYAAANEDVAKAIADGAIESPQAHYVASGYAEGRVPCPELAAEVDRWNRMLRV